MLKVITVATALVIMLVVMACTGGDGSEGRGRLASGSEGGLAACQALAEVERYRYTFEYRIFSPQPETPLDETLVGNPRFALPPNDATFEFTQEYQGSVVSPDRVHLVVKNPGQPDLEIIYIGEQSWNFLGNQWLQSAGSADFAPFPPELVCDAVMRSPDFGRTAPAEEELDGIATLHYRLDRVDSNTAGVLLGSQSDMGRLLKVYELDVWLTQDGLPARLETRSEGNYPSGRKLIIEFSFEVRDANDKDIEVEPPI